MAHLGIWPLSLPPRGVHDVLYITTTTGHLVALDTRTGETLWVWEPPPVICRINNGSSPCYTTSLLRSTRILSLSAMSSGMSEKIMTIVFPL